MWKRIYLTDLKQYCLLRFPLQMQEKHPRAFCLSDRGSPDWMGEHRAKLGTLQARDTRSPWYGAEPQVGSAPWWQSKWLFGNHSHAEGNFKDSIVNSVDSMPVIQEATYLWNVLVGECSGRGQGYEGDSRRGRSSISCDLIAWACMETAEGTGIAIQRLGVKRSQVVACESEVSQLCLTLRDPMDCSLPGFSAHGTFQARVLEWVAISSSVVSNSLRPSGL